MSWSYSLADGDLQMVAPFISQRPFDQGIEDPAHGGLCGGGGRGEFDCDRRLAGGGISTVAEYEGITMSDDVPVLQSRDVAEEMTRDHGPLSALLLQHESTELRWYAPTITDAQTPHDRDELYVVIAGRGWFVLGEERVAFRPGDALFVAANRPHRFVDFTPDLRLG
jgi:mannose-6-phosphate isomerase-like protein (cupin superfamily)